MASTTPSSTAPQVSNMPTPEIPLSGPGATVTDPATTNAAPHVGIDMPSAGTATGQPNAPNNGVDQGAAPSAHLGTEGSAAPRPSTTPNSTAPPVLMPTPSEISFWRPRATDPAPTTEDHVEVAPTPTGAAAIRQAPAKNGVAKGIGKPDPLQSLLSVSEDLNSLTNNHGSDKAAKARLRLARARIDEAIEPTRTEWLLIHKTLIITIFLTIVGMVGSVLGLVQGSVSEHHRTTLVLTGAVLSLVGNTISSATGVYVKPPGSRALSQLTAENTTKLSTPSGNTITNTQKGAMLTEGAGGVGAQ